MPFGLTNAPATFQSYIHEVLHEHLDMFVIVFLDDILIYSKDEANHQQHVRTVLKALLEAGLYPLAIMADATSYNALPIPDFPVTQEHLQSA